MNDVRWYGIYIFYAEWQWGGQIKSVFVLDACSRCISPSIHYLLIFAHEWTNNLLLLVFMRTHTEVGFFHMDFVRIWTSPSRFSFSSWHAFHSPDTTMVCLQTYKHSNVIKSKFILQRLTLTFFLFSHSWYQESVQWKNWLSNWQSSIGLWEDFHPLTVGWWCNRKQCEKKGKNFSMCCYILDLCSPNCMWAP